MAFFKFRKAAQDPGAPAAPPLSVDTLRRRAKNRLIGAALLVLLGVVGFPLLVDQQPRPVAPDLPIEIPDKTKVMPLVVPTAPAAPAASAALPPTAVTTPLGAAATAAAQPATHPEAAQPASSGLAQKAEPRKPESKTEPKAEPKAAEDKRVQTKPSATPARYVVQVGSFADEARAKEARAKIERAGFKSYAQAVETKDGKRIRVRAGPFASKAEAERVADKLKKLDLPGVVLSL